MELERALAILMDSNESNMQLDIFRRNGNILLQGYRYEDVKKWGLEIDFGNTDGVVFELMFSPAKAGNHLNLERFENSVFKEKFKSFERVSQNSCFCFFSTQTSINDISRSISDLLNTVYGELEGNYFFSTVQFFG